MERIVMLTGAGISAESGISTFRDADGLWSKIDIDDVATPAAFARDPDFVYRFHNMRRAAVSAAKPNKAHQALAKLGKFREVLIITQNVDDLHEQAGSKNVIHMHGEHKNALCANCDARWLATFDMSGNDICPYCKMQTVRPDIVWFGEKPYHMERIKVALLEADIFVAIGTSGHVHPAAGLVTRAHNAGAFCLELNLESTKVSERFHETRRGPAATIVPEWVNELLFA